MTPQGRLCSAKKAERLALGGASDSVSGVASVAASVGSTSCHAVLAAGGGGGGGRWSPVVNIKNSPDLRLRPPRPLTFVLASGTRSPGPEIEGLGASATEVDAEEANAEFAGVDTKGRPAASHIPHALSGASSVTATKTPDTNWHGAGTLEGPPSSTWGRDTPRTCRHTPRAEEPAGRCPK